MGVDVDGCRLWVSTILYGRQRFTRVDADECEPARRHYARSAAHGTPVTAQPEGMKMTTLIHQFRAAWAYHPAFMCFACAFVALLVVVQFLPEAG